MADSMSKNARSKLMSRIRGKDTRPELAVRKMVHAMGYRYRLHGKCLAGKPDLVFPSRHKVIFVHGCFWHRHSDSECKLARLPKSRLSFWKPKLEANAVRDMKNIADLKGRDWQVLIVWECQLRNRAALKSKIEVFLNEKIP